MKTTERNHAKEQAAAQLESIKEMVARLDPECPHEGSDALEAIQEDALSVEVRSGWYTSMNAADGMTPEDGEYKILLCTGGPAVQLVGDLNSHCEPHNARLEYQDWGTPWTEYRVTAEEEEILLAYARCFYFGE